MTSERRPTSQDEVEPLGIRRCLLDLDLSAFLEIETALAERGRETERYMRGLRSDEPPCCEKEAARRAVLDQQYEGLAERLERIERAASAVQDAKVAALLATPHSDQEQAR